ncbi:MAG: radical SAM protein [Prevotella sp.]|nr:radical SAM protein [Prevotella sp.]
MQTAPIAAIDRHRLATDGEGVTSLVAFPGCELRCRYCINHDLLQPNVPSRILSTSELIDELKCDNLYFVATGGGITFGGGEPCLQSLFIEEFCRMRPSAWNVTIETSLHVDRTHIQRLLPHINQWIVDIKDTNKDIYKAYTGKSNDIVLQNLSYLLPEENMEEKLLVRLPLIADYNTANDIKKSRTILRKMGVKRFDEFKYIV